MLVGKLTPCPSANSFFCLNLAALQGCRFRCGKPRTSHTDVRILDYGTCDRIEMVFFIVLVQFHADTRREINLAAFGSGSGRIFFYVSLFFN